jgi:hypothetical protein
MAGRSPAGNPSRQRARFTALGRAGGVYQASDSCGPALHALEAARGGADGVQCVAPSQPSAPPRQSSA